MLRRGGIQRSIFFSFRFKQPPPKALTAFRELGAALGYRIVDGVQPETGHLEGFIKRRIQQADSFALFVCHDDLANVNWLRDELSHAQRFSKPILIFAEKGIGDSPMAALGVDAWSARVEFQADALEGALIKAVPYISKALRPRRRLAYAALLLVFLLASAAVAITKVLPPETYRIGLNWFPVLQNEESLDSERRFLLENINCRVGKGLLRYNVVQGDMTASYKESIKSLVTDFHLLFAVVPPFTYLQCLDRRDGLYQDGRCDEISPSEREHCGIRVVGQKTRPSFTQEPVAERSAYQTFLVVNQKSNVWVEDRSGGHVDWNSLKDKGLLFGNTMSTSTNIVPHIVLAEHGQLPRSGESLNRTEIAQRLLEDDEGNYVGFLSNEDFYRLRDGEERASMLKTAAVGAPIPYDPILACSYNVRENPVLAETLATLVDHGGARRATEWSYNMFVRYLYTAPLDTSATQPGAPGKARAFFATPPKWRDRLRLNEKFSTHKSMRVIRFLEKKTESDVLESSQLGEATIVSIDVPYSTQADEQFASGVAELRAEDVVECQKPLTYCHLE